MQRTAIITLAMGAMLVLSGCGTDNPPVVNPTPSVGTQPPVPSAATIAWAARTVTDALAAEKSARDGGKDETAIRHAINDAVNADVMAYNNDGTSAAQTIAGIRVAMSDPRNTPATAQVFQAIDAGFEATPAGHCTGCKD